MKFITPELLKQKVAPIGFAAGLLVAACSENVADTDIDVMDHYELTVTRAFADATIPTENIPAGSEYIEVTTGIDLTPLQFLDGNVLIRLAISDMCEVEPVRRTREEFIVDNLQFSPTPQGQVVRYVASEAIAEHYDDICNGSETAKTVIETGLEHTDSLLYDYFIATAEK